MLYTVRYGIPRNLRLITIPACSDNGPRNSYILRWDPPSDYPIGRSGRPGTRLQYYNVYRCEWIDGGQIWSQYQQVAHINIHDKLPTAHGIQVDYDYPFWQDSTAVPGVRYKYMVRTQDWSQAITNESIESNEVEVTYEVGRQLVRIPERIPGVIDITNDAIVIQANTTFDGLWYIPRDLEVSTGVTLTIDPDAVITFAKGTEMLVHGTLNAIDDDDPCWITFQGEQDTPGCWWGISMYDVPIMSNHQLFHCRIKNGVNNIVIYNDESRLEQCDIYGASDQGVIYGYGRHTHQDNMIHDNGKTNLLILFPAWPTILRDHIFNVQRDNGISILFGANPTIEQCTIDHNAQHGIFIFGGFYRAYINGCFISNNGISGTGSGIFITSNTQTDLKENHIEFNHDAGVSITMNSYLYGGLGNSGYGKNVIQGNYDNPVFDNSFSFFGYAFPPMYGYYNCLLYPTRYQVKAYSGSGCYLDRDYFEPDNTGVYDIDQNSWISKWDPTFDCLAPIAPRIETENMSDEKNLIEISFAKTNTSWKDVLAVAISATLNGDFQHAKYLLNEVQALEETNAIDALLVAYDFLLKRSQDESIVQALISGRDNLKFPIPTVNFILASYYYCVINIF